MKTLPRAQRLRNHVLACLEHAAQITDEAERRRWLTFVVIGGGPTGVEFTGALVELLKLVLGRDYQELPPALARVVLLEGTDRLLPAFPERLGRHARKVLERRGVEVLAGTLVSQVTPEAVLLATGDELQARTAVWSAGINATELAGVSDLASGRSRRLPTDERLRLAGRREVFAIGDLASVHVDGQELPMLSPPAMQEGRYVASAIVADVRGGAAPGPVPLPQPGRDGGDRPQRRRGQPLAAAADRAARMDGLADRPHLLPDRLSQPHRRARQLGVELSAQGPPDPHDHPDRARSPRRRADRAWDGEQTRSRARRRGPGQLAVRVAFRMP